MAPSVKHRAKRNRKQKMQKQKLIDMPLDVLIEIFLYLEPLDLLHLSRTTKGFRAFLLSRDKSAALWKNATKLVNGLPACPDHLSAPAYTHLAFVPVCHGCLGPCETIEWELRMRCCLDCFPKMTIPRCSISPVTADRYLAALDFPMARDQYELNHCSDLDVKVSLVTVERASLSLLDWIDVRSRKRPKNQSLGEFQAQQNHFWGSILRHARACRDWEHGRLREKAAQLSLVKRKRVEDINSELKELGWSDNALFSFSRKLLRLPEVSKPEPLTPTEWIEIRPKIIGWLQEAKESSLCHFGMDVFSAALHNIQGKLKRDTSLKVRPTWIDLAILPAVRSVVESSDLDMTYDDLKNKFSRVLPSVIKKWSSNAVEELEQFARKRLGLPPLSKPSCLLSVIFRCKVCHRRFGFDEALSHNHLYQARGSGAQNTGKMSPYDKILMHHNVHPRNIRVLRVDVTISRRVENLVRRVGQNPSRVAHHDLRSTVKVVCGLCRLDVATRMDFERAFEHCLQTHLTKNETEVWTRVSAREQNSTGSPGKG